MMQTANTMLSVIALDGQRVFATQVGQRCHDIINHPDAADRAVCRPSPGHRELPDRPA